MSPETFRSMELLDIKVLYGTKLWIVKVQTSQLLDNPVQVKPDMVSPNGDNILRGCLRMVAVDR